MAVCDGGRVREYRSITSIGCSSTVLYHACLLALGSAAA